MVIAFFGRFTSSHFVHSTHVPTNMIRHHEQSKAMLHCWQHLTGFVCPKAVATVTMAKRAKGNRGSDYAKHGEVD